MPISPPQRPSSPHLPVYVQQIGRVLQRHAGKVVRKIWKKKGELTGDSVTNVVALQPAVESSRLGLLDFGKETDAEFTELAKGLSDLNARFASIREQAESLDQVLHQRDKENIIARAYEVYKSSVDLVHSSMGIALSEQQQMAEVEAALSHACRVRETFNRNNLLLRILTMSIRMEASRIDTENRSVFLNVAAAIAEIDTKIAQTTAAAFNRIEQVIEEARHERNALHGLEQNLQSRAQQSIDKLQQELADYKKALLPCADESCKIGELFGQTGPITMQIITSLQYQDIVRQQLEHVSSGFEDIGSHLRDIDKASSETTTPELGFIHHAACVQQAHLSSSRDEITNAGNTVSDGIRKLLALGEELISHFNGMEVAAQAIFGHSNISHLFKNEIHQLALIADQSEKANQKISLLVEKIDDVVRVFSNEIRSHEFEVKLVSLNAQIAAARLSSAEALNKLAEESSLAATSNAAATDELTQELQKCLGQLQAIKSDADEFMRIVTEEKNEMEDRANQVSTQLADLGVQIGTRSSDVRKQFASIHQAQNELLARLRFAQLIDSSYAPALRLCEDLRTATRAYALPEDLTEEGLRKLTVHQNRYTMERENELHANALNQTAGSRKRAPEESDFDNIDLFDSDLPQPTSAEQVSQANAFSTEASPSATGTGSETEPAVTNSDVPAPEKKSEKEDLGDGIELF
ncbi:MAG: hypothetical protein QM790_20855 [Nibricoccus sp.]